MQGCARHRFILGALLAWPVLAAGIPGEPCFAPVPALARVGVEVPVTASLVAPPDQVSDDQARLALAGLLAQEPRTWEEASRIYGRLLADPAAPAATRMEWAALLARQGSLDQAQLQVDLALAASGNDPVLLVNAGELAASMGHARACRQYFARALHLLPQGQERLRAELRLAAVANMWGDFYLGERAYRRALEFQPGDVGLRIKLAEVLVSAQRHDEAEQEFKLLLLEQPSLAEALAGLADLKFREGDYQAALTWAERCLSGQPAHAQALVLGARSLFRLGRLEQAAASYQALVDRGRPGASALVGLGRVRLAQGRAEDAQALFLRAAEMAPRLPEAVFWKTGLKRVAEEDFIGQLTALGARTPMELVAWAELYAQEGLRSQAIACCRAALRDDSQCFPARMNLAETLAASHRYQEALSELDSLEQQTPGNRKVIIARARTLSWSKDYEKALAEYQRLRDLNPADPLPVMEAARVAAWGKMMDRARQTYGLLAQPPVDARLTGSLKRLAEACDEIDRQRLGQLQDYCDSGQSYLGYEKVVSLKDQAGLTPPVAAALERRLTELWAAYGLQKAALLESQAKAEAWKKHYATSLDKFQELVAFRPGNQEAWFDLGQAQCVLGLCDREQRTYRQLLVLDPLHNLAQEALRRQETRGNPALQGGYAYWNEKGRGELSQMARSRSDLGLELPLFCRLSAQATAHRWLESPRNYGSSAEAFGFTLGLGGQITPDLKASLNWTRKDYQRYELSDRDNGRGELWYNLRDSFHLGAGFTREDHLTNAFALAQGIQRDTWWLGLKSDLTRTWSLEGRTSRLEYNDGNQGQHHYLALGRSLTDHPRQFKITLRADYRDTSDSDLYIYQGQRLLSINHPYWSPQDNLAGTMILEWRHDLAEQFFCGGRRHYYDIRLSLGSDTENNPSAALEAKWSRQITDHWAAEVLGLVHRSREWDAEGLWLSLQYRF